MKIFIKKTKELLLSLIIFIPIVVIYTLLAYFQKININNSSFTLSTYLIMLGYFLIVGLLTGLIEKRKGIINGLINGAIIILIGFLLAIITHASFSIMSFVKYASYLLICIIGSIIGVNLSISIFKYRVRKMHKSK